MKRLSIISVLLLLISFHFYSFNLLPEKFGRLLTKAVNETGRNNFTVWIYLSDKGPGALSKLSNPLNLVTQRSLDRRKKVKDLSSIVDMTDVPVYSGYISSLENKVIKIRNKSRWLNSVSAVVDRSMLNEISEFEFVTKIELVERLRSDKRNIEFSIEQPGSYPPLPLNLLADSLNYGSGNAVTQITQIKVNQVHNEGIFGQGIMIASFDAGFSNLTHEVFTTYPMKKVSTYDFQTHSPVLADHSHGTATLSNVGGYKPGSLIGPAFKSDFILARTEVGDTETPQEMDNWIAAAEWADSLGADVITSSLGYLDFDAPYSSYTYLDMNGRTLPVTIAADLAVSKGIVVSNSAGNNGSSSHNTLIGPADGDSVITVGAVTSGGSRASFSSVGPTTDIPARIKPDVMTMGSSNYAASSTGNGYYSASGTSLACPLNSGVCALILCANKNLTPVQVRDILRKFGSNSSSPNNQMGWGIIDAMKSVDTARKLDNTPPEIIYTQNSLIKNKISAPVNVRCIIRDNGIIRNRVNQAPLLYYRKYIDNVWSPFNPVNFYKNNTDTFYFSIPGTAVKAIVEYYFSAQDIALPLPLVTTLPSGGGGINPPGSIPPPVRFGYKVDPYNSLTDNTLSVDLNNFPNPFNPETVISFNLNSPGRVNLSVYDITGKEVAVLLNSRLEEGNHKAGFNSRISEFGTEFSSGVYFYRLTVIPDNPGSESFTLIRQMILLK